jgi:hypothetical protein
MTANLRDLNVAMGWVEAETPAEQLIEEGLAGYLKALVNDRTPQLGGTLDAQGNTLNNLFILKAIANMYLQIGSTAMVSISAANVGISKLKTAYSVNLVATRGATNVYQAGDYPLLVVATFNIPVGEEVDIYVEQDDATPDDVIANPIPGSNSYVPVTFMVPAGAYYKWTGNATLVRWYELTIGN